MNPNLQMLGDAIDECGRTLVFLFLVLSGITVVVTTLALFLGLAIRRTVRTLVRRFAERRI